MAIMPFNTKRTREPEPSIVSEPNETKSDSMRRHSNVAGAGCEKISFRVFRCDLFIWRLYPRSDDICNHNLIAYI